MQVKIIDGKKRAQELTQKQGEAISWLKASNLTPSLAVITVGDDPASQVYVGQKEKRAAKIGMNFSWLKFEEDISQTDLIQEIKKLNQDPQINGMIVQLPLPSHLDANEIIATIDPAKDVDGFHPLNIGLLVKGEAILEPCTPKGIVDLLDTYEIELDGKNVTIIGRSQIVGFPLATMLTHKNATVSLCHSKTRNLTDYVKQADILVVAIGQAHFIDAKDLKEGAVVIDVGINRLDTGKLAGDVRVDTSDNHLAAYTPVPGGVGPMTVAMLMEQTIIAACQQNNLDYQTILGSEALE